MEHSVHYCPGLCPEISLPNVVPKQFLLLYICFMLGIFVSSIDSLYISFIPQSGIVQKAQNFGSLRRVQFTSQPSIEKVNPKGKVVIVHHFHICFQSTLDLDSISNRSNIYYITQISFIKTLLFRSLVGKVERVKIGLKEEIQLTN